MSWIAKLNDTYEQILYKESNAPWPLSHFVKESHIEVVLDENGNFKEGRTRLLEGEEARTLIPVTESSAGRSGSKVAPHPLCEEMGYCAPDLPNVSKEKIEAYMAQLEAWSYSEFSTRKVDAVFMYAKKGTLWADISREIEFPITFKGKNGQSRKVSQEKTFIRWRVEEDGKPCSGTWEDQELINNWIKFDGKENVIKGFCVAMGESTRVARNHPRFVRNPGDGAKLISSNDSGGFTYRGRFVNSEQSAEIGFNVTQKAHNALRWLISNHGTRNGDQVVVAWAVSGKPVPAPLVPTFDLENFDEVVDKNDVDLSISQDIATDLGQNFAKALNRYMAGYFDGRISSLKGSESVVIMGLDSATPGRMAITYYRDFMAKDYVDTIEKWHLHLAWPQRVSKQIQVEGKKPKSQVHWLVGAPSPWNILQAAYGDVVKSNETLKKSLYERIMPCIIEARPVPIDLVKLAVCRAGNRNNCEHWEWERNLGVACALYRGFHHMERQPASRKRRDYAMSLDLKNTSRDYLFGRLLAISEKIEELALQISGVNRTTTAARLMQRFSDRPSSTWKTIWGQMQPYVQQLHVSRRGFIENRKKEIDEIMDLFSGDDFISDKALSGEYLLGFHCQRMAFRRKKDESSNTTFEENLNN